MTKISFYSIALIFLFTNCAPPSVRVKKLDVKTGIRPVYSQYSERPFEEVWDSLVDEIAKEAYSISVLDRENGIFMSEDIQIDYAFEGGPVMGENPAVILPKNMYQELLGIRVTRERTLYPNFITARLYVRVREEGDGSFILVNIGRVKAEGAHYKLLYINHMTKDTTVTNIRENEYSADWNGWVSTGRIERKIIERIR